MATIRLNSALTTESQVMFKEYAAPANVRFVSNKGKQDSGIAYGIRAAGPKLGCKVVP